MASPIRIWPGSAACSRRRDVDGVAGHEPLLRAGDHLAGVEPNSQLKRDPVVLRELVVQENERVSELGSGSKGAERVIFVRGRHTEDAHHRIADELLDRAAVTLEAPSRHLKVACHHATERLGVEPLTEHCRSGHVREKHSDDLARLAHHCRRGNSGAAPVAEACRVGVLLTAARAGAHCRSLRPSHIAVRSIAARPGSDQRSRSRRRDSNPRPNAYKAFALPAELLRHARQRSARSATGGLRAPSGE